MNTAALSELLEKITKIDDQNRVQKNLSLLVQAIQNMAAAPGDASQQSAFADAFKAFKSSMASSCEDITPGDIERLEEILSEDDFSMELINGIEKIINANPASPAVAHEEISKIFDDRQKTLTHMKDLLMHLKWFSINPPSNDDDKGQIGFKIPREIFNNNINGLILELQFLKKFINIVAESCDRDVDDIEVGEISTTDPVFWFVVAFVIAKNVGSLTSWALDSWKKVEDIRNVRAQTAKLEAFTDKEVEKIFDEKIQKTIESEIEKKVKDLTKSIVDQGRKNELQNGLTLMLKQFLARIERGMTVDIKYLPRLSEGAEESAEVQVKKQEVIEIANRLFFHRPKGEPILQIEAANDQDP